MSYLLDFVKSFTEPELNQFRHLDLIGKEESVRDEYLRCVTDKEFDDAWEEKMKEVTLSYKKTLATDFFVQA